MSDCISYKDIPYYSKLILAYLSQDEDLRDLYNHFPTLQNFKHQLEQKENNFPIAHRPILVKALKSQYKDIDASKATLKNIESLRDPKTFTITTGHQLNLFTGPLYFLYKIISVIKLTQILKKEYPDYNFVPIYWLASEDHDFEEINYFNFQQKKVQWKSAQSGAVGRFSTEGLDKILATFNQLLGPSENADFLRQLFEESYVEHKTLTAATQYLANKLLGDYGLVIIDGDDKALKRLFAPYVKRELLQKTAFKEVNKSADKLSALGHIVQVNPREVNLFYLLEGARERIIEKEGKYFVNDTEISFTENEILKAVDERPEDFSPNAIMRPLYQEVILPNLSYVGGSGELAYWLELKSYFEAEDVTFPMLLMRNSALLLSKKQKGKADRLGLSIKDLFESQEELLSDQTKRVSAIDIDFEPQRQHLQQQFKDLYKLAEKTDKSFIGAVAAQEKKQLNGLDHLEKRLLTAQKRKLKNELNRVIILQDELFPSGNLQERTTNFSEFYEIYGERLIPLLFEALDPLSLRFNIITV